MNITNKIVLLNKKTENINDKIELYIFKIIYKY